MLGKSGASMNPTRSLAPAIVSGYYIDLWLYLTAPFIGTSLKAILFQKKISNMLFNDIER
jgi:aquaporin Z